MSPSEQRLFDLCKEACKRAVEVERKMDSYWITLDLLHQAVEAVEYERLHK